MSIWTQKLASIQRRTSLPKFFNFAPYFVATISVQSKQEASIFHGREYMVKCAGGNILIQAACSKGVILFRRSVFFCHCDSEGKHRHGSPFRVFFGIFCSSRAKKGTKKRKDNCYNWTRLSITFYDFLVFVVFLLSTG